MKSVHASIDTVRNERISPQQVREPVLELREGDAFVEGPAVGLCGRRVVATRAITTPVHRAVVRHAA
jgi:hypothetical protein